jgi:fermentation-respiration switch protein FrsA (DUF1100 family)
VVLMLAVLQRSLIYFPERQSRIDPLEAGLPLGQVHTVTVATKDSLELHGWHLLPNGHRAANRVECDRELAEGRLVVLYFSGNAANRRYRTEEFTVFTGLGADVFNFDYRGYAENAGSPSEEGLHSDARVIWDYMTGERQVRPQRIVLFGESLGGAVAVHLAGELCQAGTEPAGVILRSTFSSLGDVGAHHYPWLPVRSVLVDRYPAVEQIGHVTCPILQIHGASDSIIPLGLGRRLFASAPSQSSSGIPKSFVELPGADHNDITILAEREYREAIASFLGGLKPGPGFAPQGP